MRKKIVGFMMYFMIVCREGQAVNRILFKCAELCYFLFLLENIIY